MTNEINYVYGVGGMTNILFHGISDFGNDFGNNK